MHIGEGISGAIFSEDRYYRYALWRVWNREQPGLIFIGFNPSVANEVRDDPTVTKLVGIARYRHYGGIYIGNLFALVSSNTRQVLRCSWQRAYAIGDDNDRYLRELKSVAGLILVGWGNNASRNIRYKEVLDIFGHPVYCLSVTKIGQPAHPLFLLTWSEFHEYLPQP